VDARQGRRDHPLIEAANGPERGNLIVDLSELRSTDAAGNVPNDDETADARWRELLGQVGGEVAAPLTAAIERLEQLAATGRIDRQSLRALRHEVAAARGAAMTGQQLARYASGRLRQSHERVDLAGVVREVAAQRAHDADSRGLQLRQALKPADVIVDPTLAFSLVHATLDWAVALARSPIDLRLEHRAWPARARLSVRFVHRPPDEAGEQLVELAASTLDTLAWRLTQQIAWAMGLLVQRHDDASQTTLALEFPRTVNEELEGVSAIEIDVEQGGGSSLNSKPLAGSHVLVVAGRRDMRLRVRDAIRHMGLIVDFVPSVDEAREFCRGGLPHAIVHASSLAGERFEALRDEIRREAAEFVFIEIVEEGQAFEMTGFNGATRSRVGLDVLDASLPAALMFELSKSL
jgi:hypothetical protein